MTQQQQTNRQDVEFVIQARDRASGQFQRVEESTLSFNNALGLLNNNLGIIGGLLSERIGRFVLFNDTVRRAALGLFRFVTSARMLTLGLAGVGVGLAKIMSDSAEAEASWESQAEALQEAEIRLRGLGLAQENAVDILERVEEVLGNNTEAFLANQEAISALYTLQDLDRIESALRFLQETRLVTEEELPAAFVALAQAAEGNMGPFQQLIQELPDDVNTLEGAINNVRESTEGAGSDMLLMAQGNREAWREVRASIANFFGFVDTGIGFLQKSWSNLWNGMSMIVADTINFIFAVIGGFFRDVLPGIYAIFTNDWQAAWDNAAQFVSRLMNTRLFEMVSDGVERLILGPIARLGEAIADVFNISPSQFGLPPIGNLLGFAEGGIVPGPMGAPRLAMVHGGETITPPGRGQQIIQLVLDSSIIGEVALDEFTTTAKFRAGLVHGSLGEGA